MLRPPFSNPILPIPDPFVTLYDGVYYVMGTTGTNLTVWSSPFLESAHESATIVWRPAPGQPQFLIWSPSMFLLPQGETVRWFIYFTASAQKNNGSHRIYVLASQDINPLGPYVFMGMLAGSENITTIDPSILNIDGRLFILFVKKPGRGAEREKNVTHIAPLKDPLTQDGPSFPIIEPSETWEMGVGSHQSLYPVCEGPEALYHDGRTFIVYSASTTENYKYCLGLVTYTGGDPLDKASWTKSGPVFQHSWPNGAFGPGRASFTTSPDGREDWMVYHAKASPEYLAARTTRVQRFSWRPDSTPDFGVPFSLANSINVPAGE